MKTEIFSILFLFYILKLPGTVSRNFAVHIRDKKLRVDIIFIKYTIKNVVRYFWNTTKGRKVSCIPKGLNLHNILLYINSYKLNIVLFYW